MTAPRSRRLTLIDVMILVAAAAGGLALGRLVVRAWLDHWMGRHGLVSGIWCVTVLTLAAGLLTIRVRRPRPSVRRLARQPGSLAIAVVLAASALKAIEFLRFGHPYHASPSRMDFVGFLLLCTDREQIGPAIAFAWAILALQRRPCGRADWVEWSGRALGALVVGWWLAEGTRWWPFAIRLLG